MHKKRNLRRFSEQISSFSPIPSNYCGCTWYLILYTARHPGSPCCAVLLAYSMSHLRRRLTPLTIAIRTDICIHSTCTSRPLPYLSVPQLLSWLHSQPGGHRTLRRHRVPHVGIPARHPGLCRAAGGCRPLATPLADLGIGALSGTLVQTTSYPFEVVRRRMLTKVGCAGGETVRTIWMRLAGNE